METIEALAKKQGVSRNAWVKQAINEKLEEPKMYTFRTLDHTCKIWYLIPADLNGEFSRYAVYQNHVFQAEAFGDPFPVWEGETFEAYLCETPEHYLMESFPAKKEAEHEANRYFSRD